MKLNEGFQLLATAPDGVARLRELIVSLAVQGKLVSQDPSDEPATTLLQRVRHEKDSLIADGHVKRDKPMQLIGHVDAPFAVPTAWVWTRFGAVVMDSEAGWSPSCENVPRTTGQWGVLKVSAVSWGKFRPEENKGLPGDLQPRPEYEVRRGDFLVSRANTEELVARSVIVETDEQALMMSDKIIRLRLSGLCEPQYLNLFNNGEDARRHYIKHASGTSSSMKNVSRDVILNLPIPLPPAAEQARVVAKVNELMGICDELEEQGRLEAEQHARLTTTLFDALAGSESPHALAENWARVAAHFDLLLDRPEAVDGLEQVILQLAVRGRLVPQDPKDEPASDLLKQIRAWRGRQIGEGKIKRGNPLPEFSEEDDAFELPEGWEAIRFGEIWDHSFYGPRFSNDDYVSKGGLPTIRTTDMSGGRIVLKDAPCVQVPDDKRDAYLVQRGDLLVTRSGSIGVMALFDLELDAIPSAYLIRIRFAEQVVPDYCLLFLTSPDGQEQMGLNTTSVGVPNVNATKMASFMMPLPPRAEQLRIVARVEELRRLCEDLRACLIARRTCQARFAEVLVEQATSTAPLVNTGALAAAA
ncbi:hypothetical protein A6V36_01865 [Paraburkholderia ginsengiterrae]|uniref:Type I restriction modification DNA specificity domain-containing protein n=1 Tax=Paraburkholderia ginsengiterrae TaxID=1462993 RepID=A0A1A9NCZ2_9BURK|nr:restriction endonuclease subunit S [Paraburkholderia ginsengiterrae]OAJ60565.1 hypothetical protein A6V36_01865 [Paraburkholderia ginsengiterrae]OAJ64119.1 hypothetical protein A6V37_01065 [Paraburkholderia ginsengiterrae]